MTEYHPKSRRLASAMRLRREDLGLTQRGLKSLGGPSHQSVLDFESAKIPVNPQSRTFDAIDTALQWTPGTARMILHHDVFASMAVGRHPVAVTLDDGTVLAVGVTRPAV